MMHVQKESPSTCVLIKALKVIKQEPFCYFFTLFLTNGAKEQKVYDSNFAPTCVSFSSRC